MKSIKTISWIVGLLTILAFIKIKFLSPKEENKNAMMAGKGGKMPPSTVTVYVTKTERLDNEVYTTGTVSANEEVVLMPEIAGKIVKLNIDEGSKVNKGDLLVKINDADFQAQVKKLDIQIKLADEQEKRQKQLLSISGISQSEYDVTLNQLNSLKADVDFVKAQISKTEIRAPFSGVIGLKNVSEGAYISPSIRIAAVQQIDPVKIDFAIPEKYSSVINKGDVINFTIEGSEEQFKAKVYAVEPKIDLATRTLQLRAIATNEKGKIFAGAFAKIKLPLKQIDNAIMIPTEAIIPVLKGQKVFVCKNGKAQQVEVETGIRTDSKVQITKGLAEGDSVITTGIMQLKPDALVKVAGTKK